MQVVPTVSRHCIKKPVAESHRSMPGTAVNDRFGSYPDLRDGTADVPIYPDRQHDRLRSKSANERNRRLASNNGKAIQLSGVYSSKEVYW